jgi:hypothetical protein
MTQVLPGTDAWTEGGIQYGEYSTQYTRLVPFSSDPSYAGGGTGFSLNTSTNIYLYAGYFGLSTAPVGGSATPACITRDTASGQINLGCLIYRPLETSDSKVSLSFHAQPATAPALPTNPRVTVAVLACVSGGVWANAGTGENNDGRIQGAVNGYIFCLLANSSGQYKYELLKVVAGVMTRLLDSPAGLGNFGVSSTLNLNLPREIAMQVETIERHAMISCYSAGALVLSYDDASPLDPGRCGFFAGREATQSSVTYAQALNHFGIEHPIGTVYLRDEWVRTTLSHDTTFPSSWGPMIVDGHPDAAFLGAILACGWWGDAWLNVGTSADLQRDSGNNRLFVTQPDTAQYTARVSQRLADDPVTQDRRIDVAWASAGASPAGFRGAGILLRSAATAQTNGQVLSGYVCRIERNDTSGVFTALCIRIPSPGTSPVTIASVVVALAQDTTYELRMRVVDVAGDPTLKLYVDGVQVVFASVGAANVTVSPLGTVTDAHADKIVSGTAEGFVTRANSSTGSRRLYIDTWDYGIETTPPEADCAAAFASAGMQRGRLAQAGVLVGRLAGV